MQAEFSRRNFIKANSAAGMVAATTSIRTHAQMAVTPRLHYGPKPGIAKLDSNENPFGPSQSALDAMRNATRDGAYYSEDSIPWLNAMIPLVKAGHNVVVARTFSKLYGLAGMRVGYMISSPQTAQLLDQYGIGDYTLNQAGLAAAIAFYNDTTFLASAKSKILEARQALSAAVRAQGLTHLPSATNFLFVDIGDRNAEAFRQAMLQEGVMVRGIYRDYTNYSRVSTGLPQDVARYIKVLPKVLDQLSRKAA